MTLLIDPAVVVCGAATQAMRLFDEAPDFEDPSDEQCAAWGDMLQRAYQTVPTTLDGVRALLELTEWEARQQRVGPQIEIALATLRSGLRNLIERKAQ